MQSDPKNHVSREPAFNCFIIAASYMAARAIFDGAGDKVTNYGACLNPAIALAILIAACIPAGAESLDYVWLYPVMPFVGSLLGFLFYELVYKKTRLMFIEDEREVKKSEVKTGELTDDMMMISAYEIYTEDMKVMDKAFIEGYDGKLCLSIVKAEMNPDFAHYGKLNPYTKLQVGNQEFMTTVKMDGGVNPVWNETWIIPVKNGVTQRVSVIGVWNSEKASKRADLIIGEKTLELPTLIEHRSGFLPLSYAKDRKSAGRLVWKSVWKPTPPPVATMKFDVLMWSGNRVPLEMEVTATIEDVKEKLQNSEFVEASFIRLQYQNKDLEND